MSYVIRCYEGQDEWGSKKWLAHLNLGNDIYMSFLRASKKDAEAAAREWYERESKRFKHQDSCNMNGVAKVTQTGNDEVTIQGGWGNQNNSGWGSATEHKMVGKVWMLNRATGDRARIDGNQVVEYEGKGYVKAGPRSK